MKSLPLIGIVVLFALPLAAAGPATRPAASPTTQPDPTSERLTFLTLRLSSAEESIKAINTALRVAGYKVAVAADKVEAAEKGNELMDRKGGAPVPWDQFYGKTARSFIAPLPPGLYAVKIKGTGDVTYPWNDPIRRPKQFDYLYRANSEQAAKAKEQVAAMGRKIDALLARRRQLEAEQVSLWGTIALESVGNREIATRPLYRFQLKSDGAKPADAARVDILRAAALFIRVIDRTAAQATEAISTDPQAALTALKQNIQIAEAALRESVLKPTPAADLSAAETQQLKDLLAIAKRMQLLCRNVTEGYTLALESDAANDELRKQAMRAQLQEALIGLADGAGELDETVTKLAAAWKIHGEVGVDSPDKLPAATAVPATPAPKSTATQAPADQSPATPEFTTLFDGKTLTGWKGDTRAWTVEDGVIRGKSSAKSETCLVNLDSYRNFIFEARVKFVSGNTGIYFRSRQKEDFSFDTGYEADLFTPNAVGKLAFNEQVVSRPDLDLQKTIYKPGNWNLYTIQASGDNIRLFINGTLMTDTTHSGATAGQIALQLHGPTEVYFKDLKIRPLP
ncbi:MAG: hypothetical protein JWN40_4709 [Phycisphaerales bacterium]|nr:hypothetical protein [Phycisphaerales bacterium]